MQSIEQCVTQLISNPPADSQVRSHLILSSTTPHFGATSSTHVPDWLAAMLQAQGIDHLTDAQWQTLHAVQQRQHVCLSAPAGAGRGVARLLALYQLLVAAGSGHALYIAPQKQQALAQLKTIIMWNEHLPPEHRLTAAIYDGDTPKTERRTIKQAPPHLVLTTPEMLHAGILAYHSGWRAFFQHLRCIVLADLHLCTGALGVHLAHLWRRLYRVSRHYGAQPLSLITSAPLGNVPHIVRLFTGQPCTVIAAMAWRRQPQARLLLEAHGNMTTLVDELTKRLNQTNIQPLLIESVSISLDHTLHTRRPYGAIFPGMPASLTHLHESLARLANSAAPGLSLVVVRGQSPQEQYLLRYPSVYQTQWIQDLPLEVHNTLIARQHLECAAAELALEAGERYPGMHGLHELMHQLAADQVIVRRTPSRQWVATQQQPHRRMRLRAYESGFALLHQHDGRFLGRLDAARAFREAFEDAVYLHHGQSFQVERSLPERRRILLRPAHVAYQTRGVVKTQVTDRRLEASVSSDTYCITYGMLHYEETLYAYERLDPHTHRRTSLHALPEQHRGFRTPGVWLDLREYQSNHDTLAALHTVVHAVLASLPLLILGEPGQVRGGVYEGPTVVFVEAQADGNGACTCLYQAYERVLRVALQILLRCDCATGCDRCVTAQRCDTCVDAAQLHRHAGIRVLQKLLGEVAPSLEAVQSHGDSAIVAMPSQKSRTPRHLYLSLSTQKSADEVGGWQHKHLLRLGIAVTYDTQDARYRVYTAATVDALVRDLRAADLVIGFNLRDFDYQVLQPYADTPLATIPTLAILDHIQQVLGFRVSLSHVVRETLGTERTDDSLQTLHWWHEGARERIVDYCRRDIALLRQLVQHATSTGTLCYRDRAGARHTVPINWQMTEHYG